MDIPVEGIAILIVPFSLDFSRKALILTFSKFVSALVLTLNTILSGLERL